jgi:hypothetical protein
MSEQIVKLVVDLSKPEGSAEREQYIPLSEDEITEMNESILASEQRVAEEEAAAQALADLKTSARAKLVSGQPLTEEEAATLVL